MGDIADSMIDGEFDYITGEYIGKPCGYPRTFEGSSYRKSYKRIKTIRKELALLIEEKKSKVSTPQEKNQAVCLARQEINIKYGKGWRENLY